MNTKKIRQVAVLEIAVAAGLLSVNHMAAFIAAGVLLFDSLSVLYVIRGRQ